jgi:phage-related minor tail protein
MAEQSMIVRIGAKVNDFMKKMESVQQKLNSISQKTREAGESLSQSLSVPMAATGGIALKMAADVDNAQSLIAARLGMTKKEAADLTNVARDLWKRGFGESMDEVAGHIVNVRTLLGNMPLDQLKQMTADAMTIGETFDQDVNQVLKTASVMMKNFGISGQEAMDLITVGFQKGGNYADDLLDTLWEYAPQFASMGHSARDMLNILISGAQAGAFNLDKVGDAVKEFNIRAQDGSKTTAEGFRMIGLDVKKMEQAIAQGGETGQRAFQATIAALAAMEDPVKRNQAGVALFGTMWEDLESKVITSMTTTKDQLGQVEGATQRARATMEQSFGEKLQSSLRRMGDSLRPVGDVLMQLADQWLPKVENAVARVSNWFTNLSPKTQQIIVMIGLLAAALGPLMIAFSAIISIVGGFIGSVSRLIGWGQKLVGWIKTAWGWLQKLGPVLSKVWNAMRTVWSWVGKLSSIFRVLSTVVRVAALAMTGPIGLVVLAIAGLIAIGVLLWKNWDKIKAKAAELGKDLKNKWENIKSSVVSKVQSLWNSVTSKWESLKSSVVRKVQNLRDSAVSRFESLVSSARRKFESAKNAIVNPIETAKDKVRGIVEKIKGFFSGLKLKIPKPKLPPLPHFKISGRFSLNPPSIPKISVDWYASGGIVDGATLIGAGEAGPEAIIPLRGHAMQPFAEAIAEKINALNGKGNMQPIEIIVPVIFDGREVARVIAPYMDTELGRRRNALSRAKGGRLNANL